MLLPYAALCTGTQRETKEEKLNWIKWENVKPDAWPLILILTKRKKKTNKKITSLARDDPDLAPLEWGCLRIFPWKSIKHHINMYNINLYTHTHTQRYTISTPQVCSRTEQRLPMRSSTNKAEQCQRAIIKMKHLMQRLPFRLWQVRLVWIQRSAAVISVKPVYTLGVATPGQGFSWIAGLCKQMWGEVIIWILLQESGSVESLILFGHGSGPLYYMQGRWQSNGIFDQHRCTTGSNTVRLICGSVGRVNCLFFCHHHPDMRCRVEEKKNTKLTRGCSMHDKWFFLRSDSQEQSVLHVSSWMDLLWEPRGVLQNPVDWTELVELFLTLSCR